MLKQADIGEIKGYLRDRFGIPEDALSGYRFLESGQGIWMTTLEDCDMFVPMKRLEHVGMRLLSRVDTDLEPMTDRKSTRLNSSHTDISRMPSSA